MFNRFSSEKPDERERHYFLRGIEFRSTQDQTHTPQSRRGPTLSAAG